jgi:20S proteasome alpha/beta subunit
MTIIVWDGTTLAADRLASRQGHASTVDKLFRLDNGELAAFTGDYREGARLLYWYLHGREHADYPKPLTGNGDVPATLIVAGLDGFVTIYEGPIGMRIYDRVAAFGSGRDYAYGAMSMGADAYTAAMVACQHEVNCGMGVMALPLHMPEVAASVDQLDIEDAIAARELQEKAERDVEDEDAAAETD